ncbi:MAG TPA: BamA/TamA family outer membrane protein [Gemmatimonadaceae bacterium]|jgi:outer membrane protein insertion porin family|nr:BamA/TamA family outer membrane protein [Gemmatimonadaceae bacterium]
MHRRLEAWLVRPLIAAALTVVAALPSVAIGQEVECDKKSETEVRGLHFEGNRTFDSDELSARVLTTPSSFTRRHFKIFGARRCYPDVGLKPDVDALKALYQNNGFYKTTVDTLVKPVAPKAVEVTFRITEGEPLRIDSLTIAGLDSVPDPNSIVSDLQMKVGGRFGLLLLFTDIDSINARLRNAGYPRADILKGYRLHPDQLRAEVNLDVTTGPRTRFGSIEVQRTGVNDKPAQIDSAVVLRLLGFGSGNWYSDRALSDAQRNLYNVGAYRHVGIALDTTTQRSDSVADVLVDLREDFMRQYDLEEGWATLDCFRVNSQYTDKNFLDAAHHLELTGRVSKLGYGEPTSTSATRNLCYRSLLDQDSLASSKLNYYAGATVREPTLFGTHWVPSYSVYTERRGEWKAYLRTTEVGGQFSATRNVGIGMPFRVGYTFEVGQTQAQPAVLCAQFSRCDLRSQADVQKRLRLAVASASLQRIRTDNAVEPTSGYVVAGEVRGASPTIGSDPLLQFLKGTADGSWYHKLQSRVVFAARLRGGVISGGAARDSAAKLPPPQERLYAGGATSVRGFQQNELGPLVYLISQDNLDTVRISDTSYALVAKPTAGAFRTIPVGGNLLFVANVELRVRDPFFPALLEYVPFLDAGAVQQVGVHNLSPGKLSYTPGLGVRVFSPIGPIQLNVGYNPYGGRPGTAYFATPVNTFTNKAPLVCVTAVGEPQVPVFKQQDGQLVQDLTACPSTFRPALSSGFLKHLTFTLSIGTDF